MPGAAGAAAPPVPAFAGKRALGRSPVSVQGVGSSTSSSRRPMRSSRRPTLSSRVCTSAWRGSPAACWRSDRSYHRSSSTLWGFCTEGAVISGRGRRARTRHPWTPAAGIWIPGSPPRAAPEWRILVQSPLGDVASFVPLANSDDQRVRFLVS